MPLEETVRELLQAQGEIETLTCHARDALKEAARNLRKGEYLPPNMAALRNYVVELDRRHADAVRGTVLEGMRVPDPEWDRVLRV